MGRWQVAGGRHHAPRYRDLRDSLVSRATLARGLTALATTVRFPDDIKSGIVQCGSHIERDLGAVRLTPECLGHGLRNDRQHSCRILVHRRGYASQ
ncbi:hypothetical protein Franean1_1528 [Parafrankia sp. EAN1pec]|nr:hypothetical protein Franean1_1528 [Frankia sp. EAN1pec]